MYLSPPGSKLYILNGQFKCAKDACLGGDSGDASYSDSAAAAIAALRDAAASFDAGAAVGGSGGGDSGSGTGAP
jgi:hypothetical protein